MATTAVAPRRIDNCHAPCALTGCPTAHRLGAPGGGGSFVSECFAAVISHLPIGVLAASSSPAPLSLPFCDRQGLCLQEVLDSAAVLWDS